MKKLILLLKKITRSRTIQQDVDIVKSEEYKTVPLIYSEDYKPKGFKQVGSVENYNQVANKMFLSTKIIY